MLLHDVLYAPRVRFSLVSFVSLIRTDFSFGFETNDLDIFTMAICSTMQH